MKSKYLISNVLRTLSVFPFLILTNTSRAAVEAAPIALNLKESLQRAEESSPQIKKSKALKEEAQWKKTEAFSVFLPKINIFGQHLLDEKFMVETMNFAGPTTIELIQPYTIIGAKAEWLIFDGFANSDNYNANALAASAAEKEADWAIFQFRQETKLKFFKALAAVELEKVATQNLKTLSEHLERTKTLKQNGIGTNYDVLRVEVQLNEAASEKLNAEDNVVLSKQNLLVNLGIEDEPHQLLGELPTPEAAKISQLDKPQVIDRLDYQAITDRELSAHKTHQAAFKHWVPKVSFVAEADYYNNTTKGLGDQDYKNAYSLGVAVSWNIFDGLASTSRSAQADARQVQAVEQLRLSRLKNNYDFGFWKRRYLYSASLYKAKNIDVEKAQESVRLANQSFKAGTRTSSEVLDAELDLFRARAGVVSAQLNAAEALVNLELALGKELE